MKHFLSIIGTTSTGKTDFAFELARFFIASKKYGGVAIISADSRQVYQGLEILSGADFPPEFNLTQDTALPYQYFVSDTENISIHGQSILSPDQEWSVAQFKEMVYDIHLWCKTKQYLMIVVGGTGLYHAQLDNNSEDVFIPPQTEVRKKAALLSVEELQSWLAKVNQGQFIQMNNSDKHNPRRLVRALEKNLQVTSVDSKAFFLDATHVTVGLKKEESLVFNAIKERIQKRISLGVLQEVEAFIHTYGDVTQAISTLGFKELSLVLQEKISIDEAIQLWQKKEIRYAKRQITWWKKYQPDIWFDVEQRKSFAKVIDLIEQYA